MVRGALFFFIIIVSHLGVCQDIAWVKQSQDVAYLEGVTAHKLAMDSHGNLIGLYTITGHAKFEGDLVQSDGESDILVIKYNADGLVMWKKLIGGTSWDFGYDITVDLLDNILIAGTMPEGGDLLGQIIAKEDGIGIIAKITPSGDLIWFKQFIGTSAVGFSIAADQSNNIIAAVRTTDYVLVITKFSADGTQVIWEKIVNQYGCCILPTVTDLQVDNLNNIFVIGDFVGQIDFSGKMLSANTTWSIFVTKLTGNGDYVWFNQVDAPGTAINEARSIGIAVDQSGNAYVTGYFEGPSGKFESILLSKKNSIDDRTGFIAKLNLTGKFEWATALYGRDVIPGSIALNKNTGELSLAVSSSQWFNYNDTYVSAVVGNQTLMLTVDMSGNFKRTFFIDYESYPGFLSDVFFNEANEFYLMGNFYADFSLGCFDLHGGSWYTTFLVKSSKIPNITIDHASGFCPNETIRLQLQGTNISKASKFDWVFPAGVSSLFGSFETVVNYIDITFDTGYREALFTVVPFYECYPRTEFSSFLKTDIAAPNKPSAPVGDSIICVGKPYIYKTNPDNDVTGYEWVYSGNLSAQGQASDSINLSSSQVNGLGFLQVIAFNKCGSSSLSDQKKIKINPQPNKPILSGPSLVCAGQSGVNYVIKSDSNFVSYGWKLPQDLNVTSSSKDSSSIFVKIPLADFLVTIIPYAKGVCGNVVSEPIQINITPPLPPLSAIRGSADLCINSMNNNFSVDPIQQDVGYHWSFPIGYQPASTGTNAVNLSADATAQSGIIQVFISNRCFTSPPQTYHVTIHDIPSKPFLQVGVCNRSIEYPGTDQFNWFKDNQRLNITSNVLQVLDSGIYKIEVLNLCGTANSDDLPMTPVVLDKIFIPNVISPNNDRKNDFFVIDTSLKNSSIEIFNRWGNSVYQSQNYKNDWNAENLSAGVYYYILSNQCVDKNITGSIQVFH